MEKKLFNKALAELRRDSEELPMIYTSLLNQSIAAISAFVNRVGGVSFSDSQPLDGLVALEPNGNGDVLLVYESHLSDAPLRKSLTEAVYEDDPLVTASQLLFLLRVLSSTEPK